MGRLNPETSVQALLQLNVSHEQTEANVSLGRKVLKRQQSKEYGEGGKAGMRLGVLYRKEEMQSQLFGVWTDDRKRPTLCRNLKSGKGKGF